MLGLFGKLSARDTFLYLPPLCGLISKVTANGTEDISLWQERRKDFSYTVSPKVISKAMINLECKTSLYVNLCEGCYCQAVGSIWFLLRAKAFSWKQIYSETRDILKGNIKM